MRVSSFSDPKRAAQDLLGVLSRSGSHSPRALALFSFAGPAGGERAALLVREHIQFVWRLVRRLGLGASDVDDVIQRVFVIAVQRIGDIELGRERAFLYRIASRLALKLRVSPERRHEQEGMDTLEAYPDLTPSPEDLLDQQRARDVLDELLNDMPLELKTVFILFELEHLTLIEIAETLAIPRGTVASRLRRGREDFEQRLKRLEARLNFSGAPR